jgi:DNA-binding CsgD family transcriptional regulator
MREVAPRCAAGVLDELDYPMFVVDDAAALSWCNRSARHLLARAEWLALDAGGRLRLPQPERDREFATACAKACAQGLRRWLVCRHGEDERSLAVLPLSDNEAGGQALVMLDRPSLCARLALERFAQAHGLTATEAEVLEALAAGAEPTQIAARHGVAISTVRTQIGGLREKTGARSIRQLIARLATLPPMVGVLASA